MKEQSEEHDNQLYYWGKYETINGKIEKVYIGPMTRKAMLEYDDTFRHIRKTSLQTTTMFQVVVFAYK